MCGIVGFMGGENYSGTGGVHNILKNMSNAIVSRGPDDCGIWSDNTYVGLAHRRLSILDLSPAGHQPMHSFSERFVMVYNGEIYNHLDLRNELKESGRKIEWKGHSDTETLLSGFAIWGIKQTINRCVGMFAFAVWDKYEKKLTLGRDRIGEKPLYFGWQGSGTSSSFLFSSELKSLKHHPAFSGDINRDSLSLLMRHNYIPAPHSIYQGIHKLLPGYLMTVSLKNKKPVFYQYWSLVEKASSQINNPFTGTDEEAKNMLEKLLASSVKKQMISDVPLGAFLSGGVDSSIIVALMQSQSSKPIKTFSIGFDEKNYNEANYAKAVASHLNTDHTELYVDSQQALNVIPKLNSLYCEPFADSSQIPTYLVSELAKKKVSVCLTGDGGDEVFGGYNRYILTSNLWNRISKVPIPMKKSLSFGINSISPSGWNMALDSLQKFFPEKYKMNNIGEKLHKGSRVLSSKSVDELYFRLVSNWDPQDIIIGVNEPETILAINNPEFDNLDNIQKMMAKDTLTYLPDDIQVKVDRATMGVSLEGRAPFLDHKLIEFSWSLPLHLKIRNGTGKWLLREVLYRHVPKSLIERPKMGFGIPIDSWLRGPLRDWAEDLLDENRLSKEGYFNPRPIRKRWEEHLSGKFNWQNELWGILIFQSWLAEQYINKEISL
jgi:asparagine synthase (glutamine-hydrolysing)